MVNIKVLHNSYPIKMHCECTTLKIQGIQIHALPLNNDSDVCNEFSFDIRSGVV